MASTAIPTEDAVLELEAGKIKDVPTRKKEGGGYSAENITVLEGLAAAGDVYRLDRRDGAAPSGL
jgi:DNA gyrase subunit B